MKKKNDDISFLKYLGLAGITIVGGLTLGCIGPSIIDEINDSTSPYAKLSEGLPMLRKGLHLRAGEHNVVITDSFWDNLDKHYPIRTDLSIESIKEAYNVLNQYNKGIKFNICTTNDELSAKYDIPKAKDIAVDDIMIYGTNDILANKSTVNGLANWDFDRKTYELRDLKITLKLNSLYRIWESYGSAQNSFTPRNWAVYSVTVHETFHTMGIDHINNRKSIMNSSCAPDLTQEDIELLNKYNMQFYNTTSIFEENMADDSSKEPVVNDCLFEI